MTEENKDGSVLSPVKNSAFHPGAIGNTVTATCQLRYPITCAAAEKRELNKV